MLLCVLPVQEPQNQIRLVRQPFPLGNRDGHISPISLIQPAPPFYAGGTLCAGLRAAGLGGRMDVAVFCTWGAVGGEGAVASQVQSHPGPGSGEAASGVPEEGRISGSERMRGVLCARRPVCAQ